MVALFANSVIEYINHHLDQIETNGKMKPSVFVSNDSQNAIGFSCVMGVSYWHIGVDHDTSRYVVTEVILTPDHEFISETVQHVDTVKEAMQIIIDFATTHSGYCV